MTNDIEPSESNFLTETTGLIGKAHKSDLRGWAGLSILSLGIAGVFALLLAVSRIPGVEGVVPLPLDFFAKGLVIHVVFSFIVWFLGVFGALLEIATVRVSRGDIRLGILGKLALAGGYISTVLLFIPAFLNRGEATQNNYIPAITDPVYYAGLVILAGSLAIMAIRLLVNAIGREGRWKEPFSFGVFSASMSYLIALVCFYIAFGRLEGQELSYDFNESLFWGGGHVLQFFNAILLILALYALGRITLDVDEFADREVLLTAFSFLIIYSAVGILGTMKYAPNHEKYWWLFTNLQYGLAFPTLLFAVPAFVSIRKTSQSIGFLPLRDPAFLCLLLSPLVFGVGGFLGFFVDGGDTRTPAHYHGVIAGINLSFMGLFYGLFLPLLGRTPKRSKPLYAQIYMFGGGQLLACIGLFLAGGYGAPRKTAGDAQGLEDLGAIVGMYMNGVGALIAVIGGVMFIWMMAKALLRNQPAAY